MVCKLVKIIVYFIETQLKIILNLLSKKSNEKSHKIPANIIFFSEMFTVSKEYLYYKLCKLLILIF